MCVTLCDTGHRRSENRDVASGSHLECWKEAGVPSLLQSAGRGVEGVLWFEGAWQVMGLRVWGASRRRRDGGLEA